MKPLRVLHPITRLIVGGAQENTMLTADYLTYDPAYDGRYEVRIVSGAETGPEGSLIEEVRRRHIPLTILPQLRREISPRDDFQALLKLRRLMMLPDGRPAYDIVHTHSSKAGILGRIAARQAGVPLVLHTVHGWSFHDQMPAGKQRLYTTLEKLGAHHGQALIVVSPRDIHKGLAHGIGRPQDYILIRSGIELERFGHPCVPPAEMRARLGLPPAAPVVGSVTRLSPQKAPFDLIEAFLRIYERRPDSWFVLVGDGPLRPDVEARLRQMGIADRVVLTGVRRDVPELMATFDVFVLSSLWEGLPRVLPQAMATGLPIVATEADGSAEAVVEGKNGFLVPRSQPAALAERVLLLLADRALRLQLGEEGRRRCHLFDARRMVADIDALYQRLLWERGEGA